MYFALVVNGPWAMIEVHSVRVCIHQIGVIMTEASYLFTFKQLILKTTTDTII